jgi:hypothetical protein
MFQTIKQHHLHAMVERNVVGWFMLFNTTFNNNIMEVSFIGGGKRSTVPENHRRDYVNTNVQASDIFFIIHSKFDIIFISLLQKYNVY